MGNKLYLYLNEKVISIALNIIAFFVLRNYLVDYIAAGIIVAVIAIANHFNGFVAGLGRSIQNDDTEFQRMCNMLANSEKEIERLKYNNNALLSEVERLNKINDLKK